MTTRPSPYATGNLTFDEARVGTFDEFERILHRIERSPAGRAGMYGDLLPITTLDADERELLERAVSSAAIGDRVAILGGVSRREVDDEPSLLVDPLTDAEATLLAETVEIVLPTLIGDGAWRAQIVTFALPYDAYTDSQEDEVNAEFDEDEDEDRDELDDEDDSETPDAGAEDGEPDSAEGDGGIGAVILVRLLRVA